MCVRVEKLPLHIFYNFVQEISLDLLTFYRIAKCIFLMSKPTINLL